MPRRPSVPLLAAIGLTGLVLSPLLVGYEPVGGDPDRMYRPIKVELAHALADGRLPFWSDRMGLGVPLVADSHVAAFYPLNGLLYRTLGVSPAYRLAMWLHFVAMAAATYGYARVLGIGGWGAALAGVASALSGFQAIHSSHEPFYQAMPYLPLALLLAERSLARGGLAWPAALALALGAQMTLGHFLIAYWTLGLVLVTAVWRVVVDRAPARRGLGVLLGVAWGMAIAAVQLGLSAEMVRFVGMSSRPAADLLFYGFPAAHWCEPVLPRLFRVVAGGPEAPYWYQQATTGYEACLYVGTVTWALACVGLTAARGVRGVWPWLVLVPLTFALATAPGWWPAGYAAWLAVPGAGLFRCPGRYTALTGLGLALLAGVGFERAISARRFGFGLTLALATLAGALLWALVWTGLPGHAAAWTSGRVAGALVPAIAAWIVAVGAVLAWRRGWLGPLGLLLLTAAELGALFYSSTTDWGWAVRLPSAGPALARLAEEPPGGRVTGVLDNLVVWAGQAPAHPYVGVTLPPPDALLLAAGRRAAVVDPWGARLLRRYGVGYGAWDEPVADPAAEVLFRGPDPILDRLAKARPGSSRGRTWTVVRYPGAWPSARAARQFAVVNDRPDQLVTRLAQEGDPDRVLYLSGDAPPVTPRGGQRAGTARVASWDGASGVVEHDGDVDLVVNRTYYPGWVARVNDGPPRPVSRADFGIQAVRLEGAGPSRVVLSYHPTGLPALAGVSLTAIGAALLALITAAIRPSRRSAASGPGAG